MYEVLEHTGEAGKPDRYWIVAAGADHPLIVMLAERRTVLDAHNLAIALSSGMTVNDAVTALLPDAALVWLPPSFILR